MSVRLGLSLDVALVTLQRCCFGTLSLRPPSVRGLSLHRTWGSLPLGLGLGLAFAFAFGLARGRCAM